MFCGAMRIAVQGRFKCRVLCTFSASSVYALFRRDPTKSIEEELYSKNDNPLPVIELLYEIYAISATGPVTVWVTDEIETAYLRAPLKVCIYLQLQHMSF